MTKILLKLITGITKLSFLTWLSIFFVLAYNNHSDKMSEWPFLTFTAALVGLKLFFRNTQKQD